MADYVRCAACGYHNTPEDVRAGIVSDSSEGPSIVLQYEAYADPRVDADPYGQDHQGLGDAWGVAPHAATISGTQQGQQASSSGRYYDTDGNSLIATDDEVALRERLSNEATDLMFAADHDADLDPTPAKQEWARECTRSAKAASDAYDAALSRRNEYL